LLRSLPTDYDNARDVAKEIRRTFHEELAAAMQPRLNGKMKTMPHDTYQEKQVLASWVNHTLHADLGLAIRCPRSREPAILIADIRSTATQMSRFRLEIHDKKGRKVRTYSSAKLPELELMEDPPRQESLSRWDRIHNRKSFEK